MAGNNNNNIIPKEQLTAIERWEWSSFDNKKARTPQVATATKTEPPAPEIPEPTPEPAPPTIVPNFPTALELEQIRQQAYQEGFEQGQNEGYATGVQQGTEQGYQSGLQQAQPDIEAIQSLLENFQKSLNELDSEVAQSLLDLALEVARKMVCTTIQTHPEMILKIISDAINNLPHFNQNAHLILHPDDAEIVRSQMGEQLAHAGWKIFTEHQIERGGCRLETAHSQIDATNEARWQRILESIGQDKSWLA